MEFVEVSRLQAAFRAGKMSKGPDSAIDRSMLGRMFANASKDNGESSSSQLSPQVS